MINRWVVYQSERFPLVAHAPLIAAFSFSAICLSSLLRTSLLGVPPWPAPAAVLVGFVGSLVFFLQLRIADEFKDFDEDSRYRPYRPVPRGLVSLRELAVVFVLGGLVQLGLTLWFRSALVPWLFLVWVYLAAMSKEFFVGKWLRSKPILYMSTHMIIMAFIDLYVTACDWLPHRRWPPSGLWGFLCFSFFNGMVLEVGRKIRARVDEEEGVATYTALWGQGRAVTVWLGLLLIAAFWAIETARGVQFLWPVVVLIAILFASSCLVAQRFLRSPERVWSKRIERISGLWTLLVYLSLGAAPLIWRHWSWRGGK